MTLIHIVHHISVHLFVYACVLAWLSTGFLTYHFGLLMASGRYNSPCLGTLGGWTGLSDRALSTMSFGMAVSMFVLSVLLIGTQRMRVFDSVQRICCTTGRNVVASIRVLRRTKFLLCSILIPVDLTSASTVEIRGDVSVTQLVGGRATLTNTFWFEALLDNSRYFIRTQGPDSLIESIELGLIERNCYLMLRFGGNEPVDTVWRIADGEAKSITLAQPVRPENSAQLIINEGLVPPAGYGIATPVWLAYGSAKCIETDATLHRLPPLFPLSPSHDLAAWDGKAAVTFTRSTSAPFLLTELTQRLDRRAGLFGLRSQATDAFTLASFRATGWTNYGGFSLPLRFEAVRHIPTMTPDGESLLSIVFEGVARVVRVVAEAVPTIEVPVTTRVVDRRAELVSPHRSYAYMAKEGKLWTADEMRAAAQPSLELQPPANRSEKRLVFYALVIALAIAPILYLIFKRRGHAIGETSPKGA